MTTTNTDETYLELARVNQLKETFDQLEQTRELRKR